MSSTPGATALSDSLCARLCHDIAGPLSTLSGALELAAADPAAVGEGLELAAQAAAQLTARLKLLRAAWAGHGGALSAAGLEQLATGLPPRIRLDAAGLGGEFAGPAARALVNMLLLAADALPRGGTVRLQGRPGGDVLLGLAGTGAAWPAAVAAALLEPGAVDWEDAKAVQARLAVELARQAGLRLSLLLPANGAAAAKPAPLLLSAA